MNGIKCDVCNERHHYNDEIVFFLGDVEVIVDEQYPDWDRAVCKTCHYGIEEASE